MTAMIAPLADRQLEGPGSALPAGWGVHLRKLFGDDPRPGRTDDRRGRGPVPDYCKITLTDETLKLLLPQHGDPDPYGN